jgi:transposase
MGSRRRFTAEFKREAARLAAQPDALVARGQPIWVCTTNVLRKSVRQFETGKWEAEAGLPLKSAELRRELKRVTTKRDILK